MEDNGKHSKVLKSATSGKTDEKAFFFLLRSTCLGFDSFPGLALSAHPASPGLLHD